MGKIYQTVHRKSNILKYMKQCLTLLIRETQIKTTRDAISYLSDQQKSKHLTNCWQDNREASHINVLQVQKYITIAQKLSSSICQNYICIYIPFDPCLGSTSKHLSQRHTHQPKRKTQTTICSRRLEINPNVYQ